jgi:ABC-type polysaccharide/polyol phosphate export permease
MPVQGCPGRCATDRTMFETPRPKTSARSGLATLEVIYHAAVRSVRKSHRNAMVGLLMNILQTVTLVLVFYVLFTLTGMRGSAIRGDFLLYIMSGVFLFLTHTKAMGAVVRSEGPTSPMMKHAPMNAAVAIAAAAMSALYLQVLSLLAVLFVYHVGWTPVVIDDPVGAMAMLLLSWASGVAIGTVFLAAKPWMPEVVAITSSIYMRANMIASGKLFVANAMPGYILVFFDWNPLFHTIDQARGFTFINYNPHFSSIPYPIYVTLACLVVGLMGDFYTRQRASISWGAKR